MLVSDGNSEHVEYYPESGTIYEKAPTEYDLFLITPEPELTAFEYAMLRYVQEGANAKSDEELEELTKKHSAELLAIARKELQDELIKFKVAAESSYNKGREDGKAEALKEVFFRTFPIDTPETIKDYEKKLQENSVSCYNHGYEEGKKVALKDFPMWKKNNVQGFCSERYRVCRDAEGNKYFLLDQVGQKVISISDLEKLPVFKED